jgi:hypothetical protein
MAYSGMAQVTTSTKQDISRRLRVLRYVSDAGASAAPVILRLIFSLLAVKMIAVFGSDGALTSWGIAQNTITLLAAATGFSVQTGVAARAANGQDQHSFGRGIQLLIIGTAVAALVTVILLHLDYPGAQLPAYSLVAVVAAFSAGFGSLVSSYLPAMGRVHALSAFYFSVGAITCSLLWALDIHHISSLMLAIGGGWCGGGLVFLLSSRQYRRRSFWLVRWDLKKNKKLLTYGVASIANAVVQIGAILLIRDAIIDAGGLRSSDFFESSLRLSTLVEGAVGSIAGLMIWRRLARGDTHLKKTAIVITSLALGAVCCVYALFYLESELIIALLFDAKFTFISEYSEQIFLLAALKVTYAALMVPIFYFGRVKGLLLIEFIFAVTIFIQLARVDLLFNPVANALNTLIWSNSVSVGMILCLLFFHDSTKSKC